MRVSYCFRLEKELELGEEIDTGEPCEFYMRVSADTEKEIAEEEYKNQHEVLKKMMAYQMGVDEKYITLITEEEYSKNVGEDYFRNCR